MSPHRALLLDADDDFLAGLKQSLEPCGFSVLQIRDPDPPLDRLFAPPPDLVFISVELPERRGFQIFTRVRSHAKRVPIVMATSSLSSIEMSLHAKLRLHADLYLNKRALDPALLLRSLSPLLPGVASLSAAACRSVPVRTLPDGTGGIPEWLCDGPGEGEVQAVLAGFPDGDAGWPETAPGGAGAGHLTRRIAELEAERDRFRNELAQARHDASSSPFSVEIASQREEMSRCTAELSRLQFEVGHRDRELAEARDALQKQADELEGVLRERSEILVRFMQLEEQLDEARKELRRLAKEQLVLEAAEAAARGRGQEEQERHAEALFQIELERDELRSTLLDLEEQLRNARRAHSDELGSLRADKKLALERLARSWAGRLELAAQEHAAAVEYLRERQADELRDLERSHRASLTRAEGEAEAARARVVDELQSLAEARLEDVRRTYAEELETQRRQQADELEKLEAGHRDALDRMERERQAAIRSALAEREAAHDEERTELESAHTRQLASLREQFAQERRALEAAHTAAMERNEREREAAVEREVAEVRIALEQRLQQARCERDEAVATLQRDYAKERQALELRCEASRKGRSKAEAMLAEMRRVAEAQSAELESLGAALSGAQREAAGRASALAELERQLADRAASIASLEALVEDLQRDMILGVETPRLPRG